MANYEKRIVLRTLPTIHENDYVQYRPGWCGFLLFPKALSKDSEQYCPSTIKLNSIQTDFESTKHWHVHIRASQVGNQLKTALCSWENVKGYRKFTLPSGQRLSHVRNDPMSSPCTVCGSITTEQEVPVWKCDHCLFRVCGDCLIEEAVLCSPVPPDAIDITLQNRTVQVNLIWWGNFQANYEIRCPKCHRSCWKEKTDIQSLPTELLMQIVEYVAFGEAETNTIRMKRCLVSGKSKRSWSSIRIVNRLFYDLYVDLWKKRAFIIDSPFWYELFKLNTAAFRSIRRVSWSQDVHLYPAKFHGRVRLDLLFANAPIKQFQNCLEILNRIDIEIRFWGSSFDKDITEYGELYTLLVNLEFFESQLTYRGDQGMWRMYNYATLSHSMNLVGSASFLRIRWRTPVE